MGSYLMKILVACEYSGRVRDAFNRLGHYAVSCDLLPCESAEKGEHVQGNVLDLLDNDWDMMVGFPPCTFLTCTGNKWFKPEFAERFPTRQQDRLDAISFFMQLINAPIKKIAIENPVGVMSTRHKKPSQIIQPFWFGHAETKKTCLWLKNLPKLVPTNLVEPQFIMSGGKRYSPTHYYNGGNGKVRSLTYLGIAEAMADQWSSPTIQQQSFLFDFA
jgi:hypothetical protein